MERLHLEQNRRGIKVTNISTNQKYLLKVMGNQRRRWSVRKDKGDDEQDTEGREEK